MKDLVELTRGNPNLLDALLVEVVEGKPVCKERGRYYHDLGPRKFMQSGRLTHPIRGLSHDVGDAFRLLHQYRAGVWWSVAQDLDYPELTVCRIGRDEDAVEAKDLSMSRAICQALLRRYLALGALTLRPCPLAEAILRGEDLPDIDPPRLVSKPSMADLPTDPHLPCVECGAPSVGAYPAYNTIWGGCADHRDHPEFRTFEENAIDVELLRRRTLDYEGWLEAIAKVEAELGRPLQGDSSRETFEKYERMWAEHRAKGMGGVHG